MKKTYVKPEIQIIDFTLNEAIAASGCAAQVYNHGSTAECEPQFPFNTKPGSFAEDGCEVVVEGYCYFTSSSIIFAS